MNEVRKFETEEGARHMAVYLSKKYGYAAVILSSGAFYVEQEPPFIGIHETLVAQFENGKALACN